ncbi:MAG: DUF3822 family protein [Paludibacteraceae bacterium]|nr:DUF3822 family protein [Paludibacteraceae bacterium]
MLETGSNSQSYKQSIRIATDGLSFYSHGVVRHIAFDRHDSFFRRAVSYCLCEPDIADADKIEITFCSPWACAIPNDIFDETQAAKILKFHYPETASMATCRQQSEYGFSIVYALPVECKELIDKNFPNAQIHHCDLKRIEQAIATSKITDSDYIRIYTENGRTCIIAASQGQLQLCNRYETPQPADTLYYVADICEQLHWSQRTTIVAYDSDCQAASLLQERFTRCETFNLSICE